MCAIFWRRLRDPDFCVLLTGLPDPESIYDHTLRFLRLFFELDRLLNGDLGGLSSKIGILAVISSVADKSV